MEETQDVDIRQPAKPTLAEIEAAMFRQKQVEIPVEHIFSGGVYIRQIEIPKGTLIMGKRHRHETCNMLLKGTLLVYVDEEGPPREITAPHVFTSPPFVKKFALCIEDAVFVNIHPTRETDLEKIEEEFIIPEEQYLAMIEGKEDMKCLG